MLESARRGSSIRKDWPSIVLAAGAGIACVLFACSSRRTASVPDAGTPQVVSRDLLLDPTFCTRCHLDHYNEWSRSVHAYASDDPVFVAMNKRGQRETDGGLGDFCVRCHAPMAVLDGKTTDGLNLESLDPKYKGVTCFFCHTVGAVTGTHNAALALSGDLTMRGEYSDPVPASGAHDSAYSSFFLRNQQETSQMCGACHDIVVRNTGAFIERTFCEWSHSAYAQGVGAGGQSCIDCHMNETPNVQIAKPSNGPKRFYHAHDWPAVDVPLNATDGVEQSQVQQFLASAFHGALCVTAKGGIRTIFDPAALGHAWPSGAAQDRRAWVEVVAYNAGSVIYSSGVVPDGMSVVDVDPNKDPDLWLLRDQMLDTQNAPVSMFWQAASTKGNEIPALSTFDAQDPSSPFYRTHVVQTYPRAALGSTVGLPKMPDRVTMRMRLQPVGLDVLRDLVDSGDLDPSVPNQMPTYDVSFLSDDAGIESGLEWTTAAASDVDKDPIDNNTPMSCVVTNGFIPFPAVPAPTPAAPSDCMDAGASDVFIGADAGPSADADAGPVCVPAFAPDTIAVGLTKKGVSGNFTFVIVSAVPLPPEQQWNTWVVKILDKNSLPVTNATLTVPLPYMPLHMHHGSIVSTSTSNGDGTYNIRQYFFMPGNWQVIFNAKSGTTTDSVTFEFCAGG